MKYYFRWAFSLILQLGFFYRTKGFNETISSQSILQKLFDGYDGRVPPNFMQDFPVLNEVGLYIVSIDSISDSSMGYTMSFFLRQRWKDARLQYTSNSTSPYLSLDSQSIAKIWRPDLYIMNEKDARKHYITVPNELMYLYRDGSILYSHRVTGEFSCFLNLRKFPLDRQICSLKFESYGNTARELVLRWHSSPVGMSNDVALPQFDLDENNKFKTFICDNIYFNENYTCIGVDIHLWRNQGHYFIQIYIPTGLIVMLSWSNFWLNVDAVPARISLGLLTVLTMTTSSASTGNNLPRVSYVKALDVWIFVCLFFVFAAFLEYAWVNVSLRVEQRRKSNETIKKEKEDETKKVKDEHYSQEFYRTSLSTVAGPLASAIRAKNNYFNSNREKARNIDRVARVVFPVSFLMFNIGYWIFYILWEPVKQRSFD